MPYTIKHPYVDVQPLLHIETENDVATIRMSKSGDLPIRFPGKLVVRASAAYDVRIKGEELEGLDKEHWNLSRRHVPLTIEIRSPEGDLFTGNHITRGDIEQYRDLRGTTHVNWSYKISGVTTELIDENSTDVTRGPTEVVIYVEETVPSESAPPLVDANIGPFSEIRRFDLYRVGSFVATATLLKDDSDNDTPRTLKLFDPDGVLVASSNTGILDFEVKLPTLEKSRDAAGNIRNWRLQIFPSGGPPDELTHFFATVIRTSKIQTSTIQERINMLIGEEGSKISLFAEARESRILSRMEVHDEFTAAFLDLWGLLDDVIEGETQEGEANAHIKRDVKYTLDSKNRELGFHFNIDVDGLEITKINVGIEQSIGIQPSIPAIFAEVQTAGSLTLNIGDFALGEAKLRGDHIRVEAGAVLQPNGTFAGEAWLEPNRLDLEIRWATALALGLIDPVIPLGATLVANRFEQWCNELIHEKFYAKIKSAMDRVPEVLAGLMGDDFTYVSLELDGQDLLFKYHAPFEPEPKPPVGHDYLGVIGRSAQQTTLNRWIFTPKSLPDTWVNSNLKKIEHIVVVMMENRAFDHVLGYRAALPGHESEDGLSAALENFLKQESLPVPGKLRDSKIIPNSENLKTKFDASIKPSLAEVAKQLSDRVMRPGRSINNPNSLIARFELKLREGDPLKKEDILGFYTGEDLRMYEFLAQNYAYSETYFSSHPGPTFPNRMFLLTGDVQHNRVGEAILENDSGGGLRLSREMCLFDFLDRRQISWRVYESFPSVATLRLFTRYATDNSNIVDISQLENDIAQNNLPSVSMIEPVMHHPPHNDDHPPADMYEGQRFIKRVYDALRSKESVWSKTMLVITYDEHGGFYDHVIPPIADIRKQDLALSSEGVVNSGGPVSPISVVTNYGVRVPMFVVSPHVPPGVGPRITLDHCSILKTILARFCPDRPFISSRVNASMSLDAYLSSPDLRLDVIDSPNLPELTDTPPAEASITTNPVTRQDLLENDVDFHDLTGMIAKLLGR